MKKFALLFIALVTAVVISACGNQSTSSKGSDTKKEQITVKHQLDKNGTKVPKNPKKVVVFDFGSLDTLDKLGLDDIVAACRNKSFLNICPNSRMTNTLMSAA